MKARVIVPLAAEDAVMTGEGFASAIATFCDALEDGLAEDDIYKAFCAFGTFLVMPKLGLPSVPAMQAGLPGLPSLLAEAAAVAEAFAQRICELVAAEGGIIQDRPTAAAAIEALRVGAERLQRFKLVGGLVQ